MRQAGLFGLSDHLKRLSAHGDPLEELSRIIHFEVFRPTRVAALAYGDGAKGGRPPYDPVAMLKVLKREIRPKALESQVPPLNSKRTNDPFKDEKTLMSISAMLRRRPVESH
jgi:hypothetical protein